MPTRPRLLLLMPEPRRSEVFSPETLHRLRALGDLSIPEGDTAALAASLPDLFAGT